MKFILIVNPFSGKKQGLKILEKIQPLFIESDIEIDIIKTDTVLKLKSVTGNNIYPYLMKEKEKDDIDTLKDWLTAENK